MSKAATQYKKQDGFLRYDERSRTVVWSPSKVGDPFKLAISAVTNLQQTPASSSKVALKVVAGEGSHTFVFTANGSQARSDQEKVTELLRKALTAAREGSPVGGRETPAPGPAVNGDGPSPAMAIAQAVRSETDSSNTWSDDKRLITDGRLHQSLLQKDPDLKQRFDHSLNDKPASISLAQFGNQFWSSRLDLLRAHAIQKTQQQGAYNVLAQLKAVNVDGERKLNLTREQIQVLFKQHPIITLVYNEVVPKKLNEAQFWTRFFGSKLLKKLKGERIHKDDPSDAILDQYLDKDEVSLRNKQLSESHVPHFIDLEGNEQNQKWKGNRPDMTMIPEFQGKAPLHNALNNMSEQMLANVTPSDGPKHGPVGQLESTENTYDQLRLQDLQTETADNRVRLNISDANRLFGQEKWGRSDAAPQAIGPVTPGIALKALRKDLDTNVDLDNDTYTGEGADTGKEVIPRLVSLLDQQRSLASDTIYKTSLSDDTMQSLNMTLNTTIEFLHYFWTVLQSVAAGSSMSTQTDLASLNATLTKSRERINAVADEAEKQRQGQINTLRREAKEYRERTGRKKRFDESQITLGGKKEVDALIDPTLDALQFAQSRYAALIRET